MGRSRHLKMALALLIVALLMEVSSLVTRRPAARFKPLSTRRTPRLSNRVGICTYVGQEGPLLVEWLEYYQLLGVQRFYLYVDAKDADTRQLLRTAYAAHELHEFQVEMTDESGNRTMQSSRKQRQQDPSSRSALRILVMDQEPVRLGEDRQAHSLNQCAQRFGKANDWLLFVDVDEFVMFDPAAHLPAQRALARQSNPLLGDVLNSYGKSVDGLLLAEKLFVPQGIHTDSRERTREPDSLLTDTVRHWKHTSKRMIKLALHTARGKSSVLDSCSFTTLLRESNQTRIAYVHNCLAFVSAKAGIGGARSRFSNKVPIQVLLASDGKLSNAGWSLSEPGKSGPLFVQHYFSRTCYEWVHELVPKRALNTWYRVTDPKARQVMRKYGEGVLPASAFAALYPTRDPFLLFVEPRLNPKTCELQAIATKTEAIHQSSLMDRYLPRLREAFAARMKSLRAEGL